MITNYIIYLNTLSNVEKNKQITLIFIFLICILIICGVLYLIKKNFLKENKNTLFQKILKKL